MTWHPDEGIEDDSSMTEQGLGLIIIAIYLDGHKSFEIPVATFEAWEMNKNGSGA